MKITDSKIASDSILSDFPNATWLQVIKIDPSLCKIGKEKNIKPTHKRENIL